MIYLCVCRMRISDKLTLLNFEGGKFYFFFCCFVSLAIYHDLNYFFLQFQIVNLSKLGVFLFSRIISGKLFLPFIDFVNFQSYF